MQSTIELRTNWNETIEKLKEKFNLLPTHESIYINGNRGEAFAKLQVIFGKTKEGMNDLISGL